jgi:hypothetical protein
LATLLPQHPSKSENQNYNSVDKDDQLLFVRSTDRDQIKSIAQWAKAFKVYIAIYTEKHPTETGNLMVYANTVQNTAEGCGEQAAFDYDEKFRRWRHHDPSACPWQHKNMHLYHEAVVAGLDHKIKSKKQPFRTPRGIVMPTTTKAIV